MQRGRLIAAAAALLIGCTETDLEAAQRRDQAAEADQPLAGSLPPEASCARSVLKNPLFGIADQVPLAEIPGAIPHDIPGTGGPHAMWAWRSASTDTPRWERLEVPSALYLAEGQAVSQSGLDLPAGQWRLVVGAAQVGDQPAGLRIELEGDPEGPFEIDSLGPPTLNLIEYDLPAGVDRRLTFTGLGPGEARLVMACLSPMD